MHGTPLKVRLLLVVLLAVTPAFVVSAHAAAESREASLAGAGEDAARLARAIAEDEEDKVAQTRQLLDALARIPLVQNGDEACSSFMESLLRENSVYVNLGVADAAGNIDCSAHPLPGPVNIADRPYFRNALDGGGFSTGEFQIGRVTGVPSTNFGAPVPGPDGRPHRVVFAAMRVGALSEAIETAALPEGSVALVFDPRGTLLSRHPASGFRPGDPFADSGLYHWVNSSPEGVRAERGLDGVERLYAHVPLYSPTDGTRVAFVVAGVPKEPLVAAADQRLARDFAALTLVSVVAFGLAWVAGERLFVRPVARVGLAARRGRGAGPGLLHGELEALTESVEDMTRSLDDLERRNALILEAAGDAIIGVDTRGTIAFVNGAATSILGRTKQEVEGQPGHAVLRHGASPSSECAGGDDCPLVAAWERGEAQDEPDHHFWRADGTVRTVDFSSAPLLVAGRVTGAVLTLRDVTERRAVERELRQAQKMDALGRLAGGVAHDFNNLLTVIIGESELLSMDLEGQESDRHAQLIKKTGLRAASLTQQLLAFSRKQPLSPTSLDLNGLVRETDRMLKRLIGEHIDLQSSLSEDLWRVKADKGSFEQVLLNLVVNARDAMPQGGRILIETRNVTLDAGLTTSHSSLGAGDYVMLAVTDTGTGMPPEVQSRLFEPFFTTKDPGKGTGLGLSTVFGIVTQSGGGIFVYSEVGRGTTFKLYVPSHGADERAVTPAAPAAPLRGTETVLLVEDDASVRDMARLMLQRQGYSVLVAGGADEAFELADRHDGDIHLLITDMVMPGVGGPDLARVLRMQRPRMRVLFMSGYTDTSFIHLGELPEGASFLQKPFTLENFSRKIRQALANGE